MLYIKHISIEEKQTLEEMKKNHPDYLPRIRAHAILLSNSGFKLREICDVFGICRQTAATWIRSWSTEGVCALLDKPRSGRPCKMATNNYQLTI